MVNTYADYLNKKQLPKLKKLIQDKSITREQLIGFLNKNQEKVFTKESTDEIIKRINEGYGLDYIKSALPKIKAKSKNYAVVKFVAKNLINRKDLIYFLQHEGQKVLTRESSSVLVINFRCHTLNHIFAI